MSQINAINMLRTAQQLNKQDVQQNAGTVQAEQFSDNGDKLSLTKSISDTSAVLNTLKTNDEYMFDEDLDRLVVKIVNSDTKEIVRQLPTEESLLLYRRMSEMLGKLFG